MCVDKYWSSRTRRFYIRIGIILYILLVLFSLFNYKSNVKQELLVETFTDPFLISNSGSGKCQLDPNRLGLQKIDIFSRPTFEEIRGLNPSVGEGGQWSPSNCSSWQRVAVIIPYRDRLDHLKLLLYRLHPMLQKQLISYQIFVIEQLGKEEFNRGRLMNIGVMESLKVAAFDCFVFQDVDLLPEHDLNLYACNDNVHHLAAAIDEMRYHAMYYNYAGGVVSVGRKNIFKMNGYSNIYWGWGNEDDDFSARAQAAGLLLTRPPEHIGRFKMVRHHKQWRANNGNELFLTWRSRWQMDGLNSLHLMKRSITISQQPLYTHISVDLGPVPSQKPDTSGLAQESWSWFLFYYFP